MTNAPAAPPAPRVSSPSFWRRPMLVLACGSMVLLLAFGIRAGFGLFVQPVSADFGWGR